MKKSFKSLLTLVALASVTACGSTNTSSKKANSDDNSVTGSKNGITLANPGNDNHANDETPDIAEAFTVTLGAVEHGYAYQSVSLASEGTTVSFTVVMTNDEYEVKDVKVNGESISGRKDTRNEAVTHYEFVMPASNVDVSFETGLIVPLKDYTVSVSEDTPATVYGLADRYNAGETVTFYVGVTSGYTLESVSVTCGEESVEVSGSASTYFSFVMPEGDVVIAPSVIGSIVRVALDSAPVYSYATSYSTTTLKCKDFVYSIVNEAGVSSTNEAIFLRGGESCKLRINRNYYAVATSYYINGEELVKDEYVEGDLYETYSFTVPYEDATISVAVEQRKTDINLIIDGATEENGYNDIISTRIYTKEDVVAEDGTTVSQDVAVTKVATGSSVYIEAISSVPGIVVSQVGATFEYYNNAYAYATSTRDLSYGEWSSAKSPFTTIDPSTVQFTPSSYYYSGAIDVHIKVSDMSAFLETGVVGTWTGYEYYRRALYGSKQTLTVSDSGTFSGIGRFEGSAGDIGEGSITLSSGYTFYHTATAAMVSWYASSTSSSYYTDFYYLVKDLAEGATFDAKSKDDNGTIVVQAYEVIDGESTLKGCFISSKTLGLFTPNCTINMVTGTDVEASDAAYEVYVDGEVVYTYGDVNPGETPDTPSEGGEEVAASFKGCTYSGTYEDSSDYDYTNSYSCSFQVAFAADADTLQMTAYDADSGYISNTFTYTYNATSREVSIQYDAVTTVKFQFNEDFTTLTCKNNIYDNYDFRGDTYGAVLTKQA